MARRRRVKRRFRLLCQGKPSSNRSLRLCYTGFYQYAWSLRTLDRRLEYFGIKYTDRTVQVDEVEEAVKKELEGPGQLLGYRSLHKKLRQVHDLNVPRDLVYAVMYNVDPDALAERAPQFKKKKAKGNFTSRGPNWVHSLDGHDKLMGYQNSTFPVAVYGCMDTCSRKMLWAKVWVSNSNPEVIGRFYLEYLYKTRTIASKLRLDKGTETGVMATMHAFLRQHHGDMDPVETVIYGPSTSNQVSGILLCYRPNANMAAINSPEETFVNRIKLICLKIKSKEISV